MNRSRHATRHAITVGVSAVLLLTACGGDPDIATVTFRQPADGATVTSPVTAIPRSNGKRSPIWIDGSPPHRWRHALASSLPPTGWRASLLDIASVAAGPSKAGPLDDGSSAGLWVGTG